MMFVELQLFCQRCPLYNGLIAFLAEIGIMETIPAMVGGGRVSGAQGQVVQQTDKIIED